MRMVMTSAEPIPVALPMVSRVSPSTTIFLISGFGVPLDRAAVAAGDVGIEARAADVLAHLVDDQHVDLVEVELRHGLLGQILQMRLAGGELIGGHRLR